MTVPRAKEDLITKRLPAGVSTLRGAGAGRGVQEKYALSDLSDKLQFTHLSAQAHEDVPQTLTHVALDSV